MAVAAPPKYGLRVQRWTGAADLSFLVLVIPAIVTGGLVGPEPTMSPAEVAAKFSSARTDVLVSSVLLVGAIVALFVFALGVAETKSQRRADRTASCALTVIRSRRGRRPFRLHRDLRVGRLVDPPCSERRGRLRHLSGRLT